MPVRASIVVRDPIFEVDVAEVRLKYPEIDAEIDELVEVLRFGYDVPHAPIDRSLLPNMYSIRLDYHPLGANGLGRFLVNYHATEPMMSMNRPYQTFTLLRLIERRLP